MTTMEIPPTGTPMTWEEFRALGELRAEYVDGRLVRTPPLDRIHQDCTHKMTNLLESALKPGFGVVHAWSWKPGPDEFIPDVIVHPHTDEQWFYTGTPALCVEVTAPDQPADLGVKLTKYAAYGLQRYWVLDYRQRELYVFARPDLGYQLVDTVGKNPVEIDFGAGVARVDLAEIIPDE